MLDVEAVRLQRHHRHGDAGEPGFERGKRREIDARGLRALAHAIGVVAEQVEEVATLGVDGPRERDRGFLRVAFGIRIEFETDALRLLEAPRPAHRGS